MNPHHLQAFLWLRWRLFINQIKRGGLASQIILAIVAVNMVLAAVIFFVAALVAGLLWMQEAAPSVQLLIWDGLIALFLFFWAAGLLNELQRSEALTLDKFLHLPVSLSGVFVLNYVSSWLSLVLLFFVPLLAGLALGQVFGGGPNMLVVLPLLATFFFAVTALTYQFQGWLAALMADKRRRRTILTVATLLLVLITQTPQLINWFMPRLLQDHAVQPIEEAPPADQAPPKDRQADEIQKAIKKFTDQRREARDHRHQLWDTVQQTAWLANGALPPGWLALGSASAAEGNVLPALLASAAFALIGAASLWRAYRTVLRLYLGEFTGTKKAAAPTIEATPAPAHTGPRTTVLDRAIPLISESAAVVALAGFRSLMRAPEAKMLLLSPILMIVIAGGTYYRLGAHDLPGAARTLTAYGAIGMTLVMMVQIMGNQFGFDRAGFRLFVLSPAPRREILLGKNLAIAPVVAALVAPFLVAMQFFVPMPVSHVLALPGQFVSMFLLYCLWANALSIIAPMPIASGTLKPANPKGMIFLIHLFFLGLAPVMLAPTFVPFGVEAILASLDLDGNAPICLILTYLECAAVIALYRVALGWEGRWLAGRELKILETVTAKAE